MSNKTVSKKPTYAEVAARALSPAAPSTRSVDSGTLVGIDKPSQTQREGNRSAANSKSVSRKKAVDEIFLSDSDTSSIEDSGKYLEKDDSMYKGKAVNSRVSTVEQPASIIQTRSSKRANRRAVADTTDASGQRGRESSSASRKGTKSQLHDAVDSRLSPDTPRPHSVAVIDDDHNSVDDGGHSDDNDNVNRDEVGHMPPVSSTPRNRRSRPRTVLSDSEDDVAVADQPLDLDQYDTSDPFIDDSEVPRGRSMERTPSTGSRRRNRKSSPRWVDIEAEEASDGETDARERRSRAMDVDDSVMDIDDDADANDARRHGSPTPLKPRKPSSRKPQAEHIEVIDLEDGDVTVSSAPPTSKRRRTPSPPAQRKRPTRSTIAVDSASSLLPSAPMTPNSSTLSRRSKGKQPARRSHSPVTIDLTRSSALTIPPLTPVRTFGSVLGRGGPSTSSQPADSTPLTPSTTYLGDFEYRTPDDAPSKCEVTSVALQDPLLRRFYEDLPPLYSCLFESWNDMEGPGMVSFSKWGDNYPHMGYDSCLDAVNFHRHGSYINPARLSPHDVRIRTVTGSKSRYYLYTDDRKPAMCISSIFCKESHVLAPPDKGLVQKSITGLFHTQEWERTVGFMGTAFGHKTLRAQVSLDAMQFTTRAYFGKKDSGSSSKKSPAKMASMFSNKRSPAVSSKANSVRASYLDTFSLDHDAEIPVYDCRAIAVDLPSVLDALDTLPRWTAEIPFGAFTVVAYTAAVFRAEKTNAWTVSFNLHWAMILGIAEDRA